MTNKVFMAFGQGQESKEAGAGFAKYVGVGAFKIVAVNPTKEELSAIYGANFENDIEYVGKDTDGNDQVRLDFIAVTNPEKNNGIDVKTKVSFFLKNTPRFNAAKDKVQVINKYGETTWVPTAMANGTDLPDNQSWFEGPYRACLVGEEELTGFLKTYLNIPAKSWRDNKGVVHSIEKKSDAEAQLEGIPDYFKGNVKELAGILKFQPENLVKFALGIKTTDDGKEYQSVFTRMFVKNNVSNYAKLDAAIKDAQANGAYSNTVFTTEPLAQYVVAATNMSAPEMAAPSATPAGWFGK